MKHVGDPSKTDCNLEINIAGQGQQAYVNRGATVTVEYSGQVWSHPGCPGCIDQVVIGLEDEPIDCIYHGIPGIHPGRKFSGSISFTAPTERGTYRIFGIVAMQYTCEAAKRWYREHPELRFYLATLGVEVYPVPIFPTLVGIVIPIGSVAAIIAANEIAKWR